MTARGWILPAALGVALLAAGLAGWRQSAPSAGFASDFDDGPPPFPIPAAGSYALPPLRPAPDAEVLDETGARHRLADLLKGKVTLVSFVYLSCGDVNGCPLATATLFDLYHGSAAIPALRDRVQLMTISFDPARDTPEALASFAYPVRSDIDAGRKIGWRILTTADAEALRPLLRGFGQVVDRDGARMSHLLRMFLVDAQGRIRNIYGLGMIEPRLLITDVESLLMEDATS